jgi:penicillin V acylase-like amidase (Ntn superfamily)
MRFARSSAARLGTLAFAALAPASLPSAHACSLAFWSDSGRSVVVGRNVDWIEDPKTDLWAMPRGVKRAGSVSGTRLEWTSKYASICGVAYDSMVNTGMNEKGLAANCLWLATGDHGPRKPDLAALSESEWPQFYLDMFATVAEAVEYTRANPFQVRGTQLGPFVSKQHLTIQDASGDSAVFEYVGGELKIYHDRRARIVTNEPTYDQQVANLKQYQGFGGDKPLPGTTEAADRFVRGAYYLTRLPKPTSDRATIAGMLSVMRSMAQPMGTPDPARPNISMTVCTAVFDLTRRAVYYQSMNSPYPVWVWLDKVDLAEGKPARKIADVNTADLIGDVTDKMVIAQPFQFSPGE